jgi:dipeptide/tripeptide permease
MKVGSKLKYERVERVDTSSERAQDLPVSLLSSFLKTFSDRLSSLKDCPRELYINFALKFLESYSYFAVSQILVIYVHTEFGFTDIQAGSIYGMWGIAITFWGLCASAFNDILGVRRSLLIGFTISVFATLSLALVTSKVGLFFILFGFYPIGTAMGIPMLTVGIRRYKISLTRLI